MKQSSQYSVNLHMVFIYKFCKKRNLNLTTRRTSRTYFGEVRPKKFKLYKVEKSAKKLKIKPQERKNIVFGKLL